jgi:hypothetical protein
VLAILPMAGHKSQHTAHAMAWLLQVTELRVSDSSYGRTQEAAHSTRMVQLLQVTELRVSDSSYGSTQNETILTTESTDILLTMTSERHSSNSNSCVNRKQYNSRCKGTALWTRCFPNNDRTCYNGRDVFCAVRARSI